MDYLTLLLATLLIHKGLCTDIFWDTTIQLSKTMALECTHPFIDTLTQMEWVRVKGETQENIFVFNPIYGMEENGTYRDRVHFPNYTMTPINPTLFFHNASEADVGFYLCTLHMFPFGSWTKTFQVVQSESFEKAVTLNSHMVSEAGQNVTLMYLLQKKWRAQHVTWEKVQSHQIDILSFCNLSQGRHSTSKYLRELWGTCSQGSRMSLLVIPHALSTDSGIYRCRFESGTGENDTFTVTLTVTQESPVPSNKSLFYVDVMTVPAFITHDIVLMGPTLFRVCAGQNNILFLAAGTVSLLLVILIITIIVVSCHRRRRQGQEAMTFKESQDIRNKAANNYRSTIATDSCIYEEGEDIYENYPTILQGQKPRVSSVSLV